MSEPAVTLLERETELGELGSALQDARRDSGQIVLIEAAAGLGKSSLLWVTLESAGRMGFACLRARASELEHDFPYGCMRRLLEPAVSKVPLPERSRLFEDAAALAMPLFAAPGTLQAAGSNDGPFAMLHGLYWLLNNLARDRPVAVCIDDLQWADVESLRFLSYLASRLDGLPIAVIASIRSRENVTPDLTRLFAAPEVKVIRPQPLSIEATAALCEQSLGAKVADAFAAACHGATGGNPFFLHTLLREARELRFLAEANEAARVKRIGPVAVARAVLVRLSSAPPSATALVRAIAVLGDGASVAEAARLAELSEDDAAHAADVLIELGILRQAPGLEFAHPIVQSAIYDDIGAHERARSHARAARLLAERSADEERIAAQIVKSEPAGDAARVELLRRVAARALAQSAPAAAVVWLTRALAEPPTSESRPDLLLELGSAELRAGRPEAAVHLAEALESLTQPATVAIGARQLANALSIVGSTDSALSALASAIARIEPQDRELALLLEAEFAAKSQQSTSDARAAAARRLARLGELQGDTPGIRLVRASRAFEQARASETEAQAVRHLQGALEGGGLFGQQTDVVGPFYALVIGLLATDALDLGRKVLERALAEARARGSIPALAFLTVHRGWFLLRAGALAAAETDASMALDLLRAHDILLGHRFAVALRIMTQIERGQIEAAATSLDEIGNDIPPGLANNNLLEARAHLHLAMGKHAAALEDFREFDRRDELWGAAHPLSSRWRSHACLALRAMGDESGARALAREELERARSWGSASASGIALRAAALVDTGEMAIERLSEAVSMLERSPSKLEYARALVDLGAAQRRANRRAEARVSLEAGLKLAARCNASALAELAGVELRAAGGRTSEAAAAGLEELTVSERRVAELAARGRSNPQIAQALFVTRKTVETHLGRVYSKLGIAGRSQLAAALARTPALED